MMSAHEAGPASRGNNYFSGGPSDNMLSALEQVIDLSAISDQIKSGTIRFTLSAYLGGYANRPDYASVTMGFLDAKGHMIRGVAIGPVSAADRHNQTSMMFRNRTGLLPANTQKIDITLAFIKATNLEGPGNTACADNLSMVLTSQ
ncbi:hypothetical protein KSC_073100 [Ktedonobacter sp. SOSP1-52]|uniref:hypothetical protein n=1 Tax=Ktedonobacter sp. SOSP1-52 TaxID=2778366 RepID=UPI0019162AD8|nr:hypothetical protein [Ktedonobacter sp. SOSP1-52]GHO68418.1 hypothetical protein KSC_073100 [Ktedonobacter sp. SOSP1-52]